MNQLFDGQGDKTSLAQLRQCYVPINLTSMCLGVQPQPFFKALTSIGKQYGWTVGLQRDSCSLLFAHSGTNNKVNICKIIPRKYWL